VKRGRKPDLTPEQARELREAYYDKSGKWSRIALAKCFGVSLATVDVVINKRGDYQEVTTMTVKTVKDDAYQAGWVYWKKNLPYAAISENLAFHARTCGWHGDLTYAWLDGFFDAKVQTARERK